MSESLHCRKYQTESLDEIRKLFAEGYTKVLLWLATGAGKTFVFCLMIKAAVKRGKRCIVVVRGRKLVDQASTRLFREDVPHGVLMSGHWNYQPCEKVQVCSIDTLIARNLRPDADLIIIDEAHQATSEGFKEFLGKYPHTHMIPVTATPWTDYGLTHVAQKIVHPITMEELIEEGYLSPFRYFAPSEPDLSEVKVSSSTKDYVNSQLADAMVKGQLTGSIIEHWKNLASDRKTILFAVNIKHSKMLTERFNQAGVPAEHCDADVPDSERNEVIKRLEAGTTMVVCNVGIFCTGVDVPALGAIVMARPTKSRNLYIQQGGRGTRLCPEEGKNDCLLLDHAGNISRHGFPTDEPEVDLKGEKLKTESLEGPKPKICKNCFAVFEGSKCPECGVEPPPAPTPEIRETDEKLQEIKEGGVSHIKIAHKQLLREGKRAGRKTGWAHHRLVNRFGYEECKEFLPEWFKLKYERGQSNPFGSSPYNGFSGGGF